MGKPTPRKTQPKVKVAPKKPIATKNDFFVPEETVLDLQELTKGQDDLSFYSRIGHTSLDPYAWIDIPEDNIQFDFDLGAKNPGQYGNPTRLGLKEITYKNEFGKFPVVEFEFVEPDFRRVHVVAKRDYTFEKKNVSRRLARLKYGKRFDIKIGYYGAHVKYGPFTIIETDIKFEQGTAVCKVKGRMNEKIKSIIGVEYFSNETALETLRRVSNLTGLKIQTYDLLQDELEDLENNKENLSLVGNIGQYISSISDKYGLDVYFNPIENELRFMTPFKLDLLDKGKKPLKMSYGFPSSSIDEIEVKVFRPKKKKPGSSGGLKLKHNRGKKIGSIDPKTQTALRLVHGTVYIEGGTTFFKVGRPDNVFVLIENGKPLREQGTRRLNSVQSLERDFPAEKGYKLEPNSSRSTTTQQYYDVYQKVKLNSEYILKTETSITQQRLSILTRDQNKIITSITRNNQNFNVQYYEKTVAIKKTEKNISGESFKEEGKKYYIFYSDYTQRYEPYKLKTTISFGGLTLDEVNKKQLEAGSPLSNKRDIVNGVSKNKAQILKAKGDSNFEIYEIAENVDIPDRFFEESPQDNRKSATEYVPASISLTKAQKRYGARSRAFASGVRNELTIKLKAGDWTLGCGRLIEITDLYKEYNGFYYVHAVEHSVGLDGFHTKIICRKSKRKKPVGKGKDSKDKKSAASTRIAIAEKNQVKIETKKKQRQNVIIGQRTLEARRRLEQTRRIAAENKSRKKADSRKIEDLPKTLIYQRLIY